MKIAVFADLHLHPFPEFGSIVKEPLTGLPINSRLNDQLQVLRSCFQKAKDKGAEILVIAGDVFHVRGSVPVDVYQFTYDLFRWAKEDLGLAIQIITGNHDQMDKEGKIHSVYGLRDIAEIIDTPDHYSGLISFIPYMSSSDQLKKALAGAKKADLLIAHCGVDGAEVGPIEYRIKDPVTLEDVPTQKFEWVLLGHYHKPQSLGDNVLYIGSPYQLNRGERGDQKRWLLYDSETEKLSSFKTGAPEFHSITSDELTDDMPYGYWDISLNGLSAAEVQQYMGNFPHKILANNKAKVKEARIQMSEEMTDEDILRAYIKYRGIEKGKKLHAMGMELLARTSAGILSHSKMVFQKVVVDNFLSIGHAELDLQRPGSVIAVLGDNRDADGFKSNGSGKSSLLPESIFWCLYGETARGIPADAVVNKLRKRNCCVTVTLKLDKKKLEIIRYRKNAELGGSGLAVICDGQDVTLGTTKQTEELLSQILGIDYTTFSSVVAFSPDTLRFVSSTDANQKHVLDSILQTRRFSAALDQAKAARNLLKTSMQELLEEKTRRETRIETLQTNLEQYQLGDREFATKEKDRVRRLKMEIEDLEDEVKTYQDLLADTEEFNAQKQLVKEAADAIPDSKEIRDQLASANQAMGRVETSLYHANENLNRIQKLLDKANAQAGKPCPTCGQAIANTGKLIAGYQKERNEALKTVESLERQVAEAQEAKAQVQRKVSLADKAQNAYTTVKMKLDSMERNRDKWGSTLSQIKSTQESLRQQIDQVPENPYKAMIEKVTQQISSDHKNLEIVDQNLGIKEKALAQVEFWVEGFGNQGVRSFLLDTILPDLTRYANEFAERLTGGTITVEFSTFSEGAARDKFQIRAWNMDGSDIYAGNSSGEKRRIDICVMMALFKIAYNRTHINILLLDEALDTLDSAGLENVVGMLEDLARDLNLAIFVTSHTDLNQQLHESITIRKTDGLAFLV